MAASKVMHGARAILNVNGQAVGFFASCSWSTDYTAEPAWILGRYSAGTIAYTGADLVRVDCSGYRIVDHGPYAVIAADGTKVMPTLNELLLYPGLSLSIVDRATEKNIMEVQEVFPVSFRTGVSARQLQDMSISFIGRQLDDETTAGKNKESNGQAELP